MRFAVLLFIDLMILLATTLKPGGVKSVIAENLVLTHQLIVLGRAKRKAPNLKSSDRFLLGMLTLFMNVRRRVTSAVIVKPSSLLKFHRALVKRKYSRLFSNKINRRPGPKGPSQGLINAVVEINKDVVRRILAKHYKPKPGDTQGLSWLSLLGHNKDSLWSIDLFRCEFLTLQSHWVLVVMDQWSRRIIGFGIHKGDVDGVTACRMLNQAISGADRPHKLSTDNDPLFKSDRWQANLRILEVSEIKSIPYAPMSHPFIERVIVTIRREYLDYVPFWNSLDLARKLEDFKAYYNNHRTHEALSGQSPARYGQLVEQKLAEINNHRWKTHCRGLFLTPTPA